MKIKHDFVTNSSSSSFVISKDKLSELQIYLIKNHKDIAEAVYGRSIGYDHWDISETDDEISGFTTMDNFDIVEYMCDIGINYNDIEIDQS